ncbi:hypothetical protein CLUG_05633 [Clavispora lusitaniae ATCC 42720]|uniref:Uncharacterized protein n=1 Tax=Clavispora lusitaniae (strain ATCC 42720) TaxID=306902 RepID=C4YBQ5_CLAL4|nr:uncharacterized protein CLUG_05633 [Clavispora lusitaniae ATCC 42720]EEQ41504.1 hypothetical protein CLUG_05633 [Clavispora lusitaniae ATCC 42720]
MVVDQVAGVRVQTLQVERREVRVDLGTGQLGCAGVSGRLKHRQRSRRRELAEVVRQQADESAAEVARKRREPRRLAAQRMEHHACVLACKSVGRLAQVHRHEAGTLPETVQQRRQAVRHAHVVQVARRRLRESQEQRRQRRGVAQADLVLERGARKLGVGDTGNGLFHHVVLRDVGELALEVVLQQRERSRAVAHSSIVRVCGYANHTGAAQRRKLVVSESSRHEPRNQVAASALSSRQSRPHALLRDSALQGQSHHAERVGNAAVASLSRRQEHVESVRRRVAHQSEVVGRVLVVRRHVERHHAVQKRLRHRVVREQRVSVHTEERALVRVRCSSRSFGHTGVETQELVEPLLHRVARRVPDGLVEHHFTERSARVGGVGSRRFFPQSSDQLQRQRAAGAFVAVDGGRHEHEVGPQETAHDGERNRRGLVHNDKLRSAQKVVVGWGNVSHGSAVGAFDVDTNDGLVERRVGQSHGVVVGVLGVAQGVEAAEHKLEKRLQVFRRRRRHKNVGVAVGNGRGNGNAERRRLASTTACRQRHGAAQAFLRNDIHKRQDGSGSVDGLQERHERARGSHLGKRLLQQVEFCLCLVLGRRQRHDVFPAQNRQNIQLVVHHQARGAQAQRQQEALVETRHHVAVRLGPVPRVHVHGHGVESFQGRHGLQENHHKTAAFNGLDRPRQQVGRERLEVSQNAHAVRVTQDLLRFLVVDIADVSVGDKGLERVSVVGVACAPLDLLLDLVLALLAVRREPQQSFFVRPENRLVHFEVGAHHKIVQVGESVARAVAHDDEEGPSLFSDSVSDQRGDPRVDGFFSHEECG